MGKDVIPGELRKPVDGGGEPDRFSDGRGSRLEARGRFEGGKGCFVHRLHHAAAAKHGRYVFEEIALCIEHADAGGAIELVAGEDEEVAIERLDIDGMVGDELRRIDEDARVCGVGACDDSLEIRLYSKDIALACDGDDVDRVFCEDAIEVVVTQFSIVMDVDPMEARSPLHPGNDVTVVFQF